MSALRRTIAASLLACAIPGSFGCHREAAPHRTLPAPSPPRELTPPGAGVERGAGANSIAPAPRDRAATARPRLELAYDERADRLELTARGVPLAEVLTSLARAAGLEIDDRSRLPFAERVDTRLKGVDLATGVASLLWAYDKAFSWTPAAEVDGVPRLARILVLAPAPPDGSSGRRIHPGVDLADALLDAVENGDEVAVSPLAKELATAGLDAGRRRAAAALAGTLLATGPEAGTPALRARAARALGWLRDAESEPALRHAFLTGEREVRSAAAEGLRRRGVPEP